MYIAATSPECYANHMPKVCARAAIVYAAINKATGEQYIGFTTRTLRRRKGDHLKGAFNGLSHGRFPEAIREHGPDAFLWRVLGTYPSGAEAIAEEQRLIKARRPAYNATKGGHAYRPKVVSGAERAILSAHGKKNIKRWRKFASLGPAALAKRVVCLDDGAVYASASAAAAAYGAQKSAVMEVCLRHLFRRTAAGRVFRYEGDHTGGVAEATQEKIRPKAGCTNPYQGVHPHTNERGEFTGRWRARLSVGGRRLRKNLHLGIFDTPEEAHEARLKEKTKRGRR